MNRYMEGYTTSPETIELFPNKMALADFQSEINSAIEEIKSIEIGQGSRFIEDWLQDVKEKMRIYAVL